MHTVPVKIFHLLMGGKYFNFWHHDELEKNNSSHILNAGLLQTYNLHSCKRRLRISEKCIVIFYVIFLFGLQTASV